MSMPSLNMAPNGFATRLLVVMSAVFLLVVVACGSEESYSITEISVTVEDNEDAYELHKLLEQNMGQVAVLKLEFRKSGVGGISKFFFRGENSIDCSSSDPHKLCFRSGESSEIEMMLPNRDDVAGKGSKLLLRFPTGGTYLYGYETDSNNVALKGVFLIQTFGHVGQGYWVAELIPEN